MAEQQRQAAVKVVLDVFIRYYFADLSLSSCCGGRPSMKNGIEMVISGERDKALSYPFSGICIPLFSPSLAFGFRGSLVVVVVVLHWDKWIFVVWTSA